MNEKVINALLLTGLGAMGTALGGLIVVLQPKMQFKRLGYLQVGIRKVLLLPKTSLQPVVDGADSVSRLRAGLQRPT